MSTANKVFREFINTVSEDAPNDNYGTSYYCFTNEVEDLLAYLKKRTTPFRYEDGPRVVELYTFDDGSVIRFADLEQADGPCQIDVLDATMNNKELQAFAGVLVRMALRLMTRVSEKPANLNEIDDACTDAEDAIANIRERFGLRREE